MDVDEFFFLAFIHGRTLNWVKSNTMCWKHFPMRSNGPLRAENRILFFFWRNFGSKFTYAWQLTPNELIRLLKVTTLSFRSTRTTATPKRMKMFSLIVWRFVHGTHFLVRWFSSVSPFVLDFSAQAFQIASNNSGLCLCELNHLSILCPFYCVSLSLCNCKAFTWKWERFIVNQKRRATESH